MEGNSIGIYKACIKDINGFKDLVLPSLFSESNEFNLNLNINPNLKVSTLLLSYRSLHLTARTDKPHADTLMSLTSPRADTPTIRQASHRYALRS